MNTNTNKNLCEDKIIELNYKNVLKFLIPSLIGVALFIMPVKYEGNITIILGIISEWLADILKPISGQFITSIMVISAILSTIGTIFKPKFITENKYLEKYFVTSAFFLVFRIMGAVFGILVLSKLGHEYIYSADTGGLMIGLVATLISWFLAAAFLMPLLMDYGIMDYTGTVLRGAVKPLFRLPGRSAIDLIASWIGNSNVGVQLTSIQYSSGYYTGREAATIATCFSAVSLPFCLVVAAFLKVDHVFIPLYLTVTFAGTVCAIILARIWPLNRIEDKYHPVVGKQINEVAPEGLKTTQWALQLAVQRAQKADSVPKLLGRGLDIFLSIIFTLSSLVMAWGTIALIIATYTPVFDWLSLPFAYYLKILGVPEAFEAAPATIVGFADMFLPAILGSSIASVKTRFVIAAVSLVQIVFMTETGTIILTSDIPIDFKDLLIVFLQRTIISLPIIVFFANMIIK
ncbi:YjiH family protein [Wukongibacter baidiensis]|uniref:YjiH family protein n=1 Tax=Wukongibacter baidiensis TaxID=1723361 RepID=UPI003D7F95C7